MDCKQDGSKDEAKARELLATAHKRNDDNRHLPYMKEGTHEHAASTPRKYFQQ